MSKIRFSKEEQARLRTLIAVEKVSDKTLVFTQAFKRRAVLLSRQGKTANQIFKGKPVLILTYFRQNIFTMLSSGGKRVICKME